MEFISGAGSWEVTNYKDGQEEVFAYNGPIGMGIATYKASSKEAEQFRSELFSLRGKRQKITVDDVDYRLRVEIFDSSGEDVFRVTIQKS
jgi:hypothetical protein